MFFRTQFLTTCVTIFVLVVYMGRKQIQKLCDWYKKKHSKVIELKLAPIENVVEVKKQSSFNNKAVNDKIVTAAKMYLVLTIVVIFSLVIFFYTKYYVSIAHRVNITIFFSYISRLILNVIAPAIMYINNASLRDFVISGIKDCLF